MHWIALQPLPDDTAAAAGGPAEHATPSAHNLAALQAALGWWALQFTPRVALQDEAVLLEISGSERLFGGRAMLLRRVLQADGAPTPLAWARGSSSLLALARLRWAAPRTAWGGEPYEPPPDGPAAQRITPDALPLHTLSAAREHLPTLARLGCNTWGALRALPRGGVVRRFGAGLLDALDCAFGLKPEAYLWLRAPEVFDVKLELHALVESAPALMFAAQRLLTQLQTWLQLRQSGVLALQWTWLLDARRSLDTDRDSLLIRTAESTRNMTHLARLTAEQLAHCTLTAPAHSLCLRTLEVQAVPTASQSLLLEEQRHGDSLHQLVERLSARLGAAQVQCLQAQAAHRPENMQASRAAAGAIKALAGGGSATAPGAKVTAKASAWDTVAHAALYPTWLLRTPLRLALQGNRPLYQGALQLLVGPQRLEVMDWAQASGAHPARATLRDYFIALSPHAGLLWVYRERLPLGQGTDHWFLHGLYA